MRRSLRSRRRAALAAILLLTGCAMWWSAVAVPSTPSRPSPTDQPALDEPPAGMPQQILTLGPATKTSNCRSRRH